MELGKDDILEYDDLMLTKIDVPEWHGHVYIRSMSGLQRADYEDAVAALPEKHKGGIQVIARYLVRVLTDAHNKRMFADEDCDHLSGKRWDVLMRIFSQASKINAIDQESLDALEKN